MQFHWYIGGFEEQQVNSYIIMYSLRMFVGNMISDSIVDP